MTDACFLAVSADQTKIFLAAASFVFATVSIFFLRKNFSNKIKISLIYTHLATIFFPFVLFSTNLACGAWCLPCFNEPVSLVFLSLPTTLLFAGIAGFVAIPGFYLFSRKSYPLRQKSLAGFVSFHAKKLQMKAPKLYLLDRAKPVAFSFKTFRSAIFLSVGMLDILTKKEIEAVLLHELYHIKSKSSLFKFSSHLLKFSPFSILKNFSTELSEEEKKADGFVESMQKTAIHLLSAKRKSEGFK